MPVGKSRVGFVDVSRRLADDFDIANHGILRLLVFEELGFRHFSGISACAGYRIGDVLKVIRDSKFLFPCHTGTASSSTY